MPTESAAVGVGREAGEDVAREGSHSTGRPAKGARQTVAVRRGRWIAAVTMEVIKSSSRMNRLDRRPKRRRRWFMQAMSGALVSFLVALGDRRVHVGRIVEVRSRLGVHLGQPVHRRADALFGNP